MLQASQFDGVAFDPFSLQKDCSASAEVDVGRAGRCDCSTRPMISSLSDAGSLMFGRPHPQSCVFFEQPQFECLLGDNLLQVLCRAPELLDLIGRRGPRRVAGDPALAVLQRAGACRPPGTRSTTRSDKRSRRCLASRRCLRRRQRSAIDVSPRRPSSTMPIFSSRRAAAFRVARRMLRTSVSDDAGAGVELDFCLICRASRATMSQKSSVPQAISFVSHVRDILNARARRSLQAVSGKR